MSGNCQAVIAHFAWFSQTCNQPAVGVVHEDGETFNACAEHLGDA